MIADVAGDGNGGHIASEAASHRIDLAHVNLHGGLVGGLEQLVGPRAERTQQFKCY